MAEFLTLVSFLALAFGGLAIYVWWCQVLANRRMVEIKRQYEEYLNASKEISKEANMQIVDELRAIRTLLEIKK
jgi:hypothetical protein